ncbi:MAG: glycoside hydrolase family 76 protein [Oscillospiraceae bacterium]|nr:glycoside hydrolase family 76 protein [Oscillospiraceae bacterium]
MTVLFSRIAALFLAIILELTGFLPMPPAKRGLEPAEADGTFHMQPAEQAAARAEVLAESYFKQYYDPLFKRLSFYPYSFRTASCWEYIGLLSLVCKLAAIDETYLAMADDVLEGLRHYRREYKDGSFAGYAVNRKLFKNAPATEDIAYDDNMWLGRDIISLYELTGEGKYFDMAAEIADWLIENAYVGLPPALFEEKGLPVKDEPVGGFYWSYNKDALHTCSNGPAAQFLAALYRAGGGQEYLDHAKASYNFLYYLENSDGVFHDLMRFEKDAGNNITAISGYDAATYSYNSGSPITAAIELYRITEEERYLLDAEHWAASADAYYARTSDMEGVRQYPPGNAKVWFNLVLLNGYAAFAPYSDGAAAYIENMRGSINYAYDNYRSTGFWGVNENILPTDWVKGFPEEGYRPVALDVSAAAEIYAMLHILICV